MSHRTYHPVRENLPWSRTKLTYSSSAYDVSVCVLKNYHSLNKSKQETNNDYLSTRRMFVREFYKQELTPKLVANAVSTVTRICKICFQIGLFISSKLIMVGSIN